MTTLEHDDEAGPQAMRRAVMARTDSLDFHPRNVRADLGDLRELAASIAQVGVLEPLLVEDRGPRGRVLAGHRRLAASRLAGLKRVPCVLVDRHSDEDAIVTMVAENKHRLGLTPAEKTKAARSLRDEFGWTQAQIAQRFGVHPQTVGRWLTGAMVDSRQIPGRALRPAALAYRPKQQAPKPPKVTAPQLHDVLTRWETTAPAGLLEELRGLLGGWTP